MTHARKNRAGTGATRSRRHLAFAIAVIVVVAGYAAINAFTESESFKLANSIIPETLSGLLLQTLAVAAAVIGATHALDESFNDEYKDSLTEALQSQRLGSVVREWPRLWLGLVDRIFGPRLISVRSFFVSASLTIGSIVVLTLFWLFAMPWYRNWAFFAPGVIWQGVLIIGTGLLLLAIVADYLSVIIIRALLGWTSKRPSFLLHVGTMVASLLLALTLYAVLVRIPTFILVSAAGQPLNLNSLGDVLDRIALVLNWDLTMRPSWANFPSLGVFLYSALLPTLWAVMFVLAMLAIQVCRQFDSSWAFAVEVLNVEEHPLRSMGLFASLIFSTAWILYVVSVWIFR